MAVAQQLTVGGISFSPPRYFQPEMKTLAPQTGFLRHEKYDLGVFVSVPERAGDEWDLAESIGIAAAKELFPQEVAPYRWKRVDSSEKLSKLERSGGLIQGFNGSQRVIVEFRRLDVQNRTVYVGYVSGLGAGREAGELFEKNLAGGSMPGTNAQLEIISSITGEKLELQGGIPGVAVTTPPPPPPLAADYFPDQWTSYTPTGKAFTVRFPAEPTEWTESQGEAGFTVQVHGVRYQGLGQYRVQWVDYPQDVEQTGRASQLFDIFQNAMLEKLTERDARVTEKSDKLIDGHPSRFVRIDVGESTVLRVRWLMVGGRLYEQSMIVPNHGDQAMKAKNGYQEIASAFFDSFRLLPPVGA